MDNWFKLSPGHKFSEWWDKIDLKEKQGEAYVLAARGESRTSLYLIWWVWIGSVQPVVRRARFQHRTFHESSVNIFFIK